MSAHRIPIHQVVPANKQREYIAQCSEVIEGIEWCAENCGGGLDEDFFHEVNRILRQFRRAADALEEAAMRDEMP